jgi:hypothetical protein
MKIALFLKMISLKNNIYEKLFKITFYFRDFFKFYRPQKFVAK